MIANVNNVNLYYEKTGTGQPLILLHGNGESHHIFDTISAKLQNDFTLYAIDSRNHGQSEQTEDYSYETMAEDVHALITLLNINPVGFIGFSDGAIISLIIAMKHPHVVSKMALLGVNLKPEDFTEESLQFINETYAETGDPLFRLMLEQPRIELSEVEEINIPTLLIAAENDIFKPESFKRLEAAMPSATLKIMQGHEHDSYITDKDILYPDFLRFFK